MGDQMPRRVSKSRFETQGRGKSVAAGEKKTSNESSKSQTYTQAYQAILTKELFINDFQENYWKSY
jgi:hypothetical protein